jgi:hypothetical protein
MSLLEVCTEVWVVVLQGGERMLHVTMLISTWTFLLAVQTSTPYTISFTTSKNMRLDLIQSVSQNIIVVRRFRTEIKGPHPRGFNSASAAGWDILFYETLWTYFFCKNAEIRRKPPFQNLSSSLTPKTKDCSIWNYNFVCSAVRTWNLVFRR